MTRRHRIATLLAMAATLALAACGGEDGGGDASPGLEPAVAEDLASRSESLAAALDAGRTCDAAQQADALQSSAEAAIAAGEVPEALRAELVDGTRRLVDAVNCPEPPPEPPPVAEEPPRPRAPSCDPLKQREEALKERRKAAEERAKGNENAREGIKERFKAEEEALKEQIRECEAQRD